MITKHRNGSVMLKFDNGDIGMTIGGEYGLAAVMFQSQEPREAVSPPGFGPVEYASTCDFPVTMVFKNTESVDMLIQYLWAARKIVEGQIVLCPGETKKKRRAQ